MVNPGNRIHVEDEVGEMVPSFNVQSRRGKSGKRDSSDPTRPAPDICNPGNLIRTTGGGGHLGHKIAHENEAPYPELLVEFFIRSFVPPGGSVCDPFSGSGTTVAVADRHNLMGVGFDLRMSQCRMA